jgi:hypothetical protein
MRKPLSNAFDPMNVGDADYGLDREPKSGI